MKRLFLVTIGIIFSIFLPTSLLAQEDYAVLKDGTITFYYDNNKATHDGTIYNVSEELSYGYPSWLGENFEVAVFDDSFFNFSPTTAAWWFNGCTELKEIVNLSNLNLTKVEDMSYMFAACSGLEKLDLNGLYTGNVKKMEWLFYRCSNLTELNLRDFDTKSVESMYNMFNQCGKLEELDLSSFNTFNVTNMGGMFQNCGKLNTVYVSEEWTTIFVGNSDNMFFGCIDLVGGEGTKCDGFGITTPIDETYARIDTSSKPGYFTYKGVVIPEPYAVLDGGELTFFYDGEKASRIGYIYDIATKYVGDGNFPAWKGSEISKVIFDSSFSNYLPTSTARWFHSCSGLTELEGIENLNTSEVNSMMSMFYGCSSLTSLDLSGFITSNVTSLYCMFYECSSLQLLDLSSFDTKNVEDMTAMFYGCSNLERVDMSSFDTRNVVNMEYLFFECGKLITVYAGDGWSTEKLTFDTGDMMFWDCTSLVGGEGQQCDGITLVSYLFAKIDEPASPGYFTYKSSNPDTAIQKVIVKREKDYYYSINGQPHSTPVKGINIKNGKKYMVR